MSVSHDGPLPWVSDKTIGEVLQATVAAHPDRDAVVFPALGVRWSWSELGRRVEQIARALIELGIEAGEHVGLWSMNVPEWVVTQFAAARIGAVLVNVNPAYQDPRARRRAARGRCQHAVVGCAFKGSDFVGMVHSVCPEVACASAR